MAASRTSRSTRHRLWSLPGVLGQREQLQNGSSKHDEKQNLQGTTQEVTREGGGLLEREIIKRHVLMRGASRLCARALSAT